MTNDIDQQAPDFEADDVTIEAPVVTDLGKLTKVTLGNQSNDTRDMKRNYW